MAEMLDMNKDKAKKQPTIWHAVEAGILLGVLAFLILEMVFVRPIPTLIDILKDITIGGGWFFLFLSFACTIGAYIGKVRKKSFKALWTGAIIGLVVGIFISVIVIYWIMTRIYF